mgnify:CR=1 FL=1
MLDTWSDSAAAWSEALTAWLPLESPELAAPVGRLGLAAAVQPVLSGLEVVGPVAEVPIPVAVSAATSEASTQGYCLAALAPGSATTAAVVTVDVQVQAPAAILAATISACLAGTGVREVRLLASPCATRVIRASPLSGRAGPLASFLARAACLVSPVEIEQS